MVIGRSCICARGLALARFAAHDGDLTELLARGAELDHVALGEHRERLPGREQPVRHVQLVVGAAATDELARRGRRAVAATRASVQLAEHEHGRRLAREDRTDGLADHRRRRRPRPARPRPSRSGWACRSTRRGRGGRRCPCRSGRCRRCRPVAGRHRRSRRAPPAWPRSGRCDPSRGCSRSRRCRRSRSDPDGAVRPGDHRIRMLRSMASRRARRAALA